MLSKKICKKCVLTNTPMQAGKDGVFRPSMKWGTWDDEMWRGKEIACSEHEIKGCHNYMTVEEAEQVCTKKFEHAIAAAMGKKHEAK